MIKEMSPWALTKYGKRQCRCYILQLKNVPIQWNVTKQT